MTICPLCRPNTYTTNAKHNEGIRIKNKVSLFLLTILFCNTIHSWMLSTKCFCCFIWQNLQCLKFVSFYHNFTYSLWYKNLPPNITVHWTSTLMSKFCSTYKKWCFTWSLAQLLDKWYIIYDFNLNEICESAGSPGCHGILNLVA